VDDTAVSKRLLAFALLLGIASALFFGLVGLSMIPIAGKEVPAGNILLLIVIAAIALWVIISWRER
jgi:hypothetical protein